jgi:hypothetical protein
MKHNKDRRNKVNLKWIFLHTRQKLFYRIIIPLIIFLLFSLYFSTISEAIVPTTYYVYTCVEGYSLETVTSYNETIATTVNSILCINGCSENNTLNYHPSSIPQADLCNNISTFYMNFYLIGAFIGAWLFLAIFYILSKKLPEVIRPFIWFMIIMGTVVLLFSTPYPDIFTPDQLQMFQIFVIISIMFIIVLGLFSVRG